MALTLGDNFSYLGTKPLDGRIKYSTISEMVAMSDSTLYDGILAYCVADGKNYQWKSTNDTDLTLGKWREFSSGGGAVDSVNGQTGVVVLDAEDVGALPDNTSIPSKTSDLTNDSGFIANTVNNLVNYYLKSETYTQAEVNALISAIVTLDIQAVSTLPTENISRTTIYLVPNADPQTQNIKDEYINLDGTSSGWELIGSTAIDLSGYVTTTALNAALADYTTTANLTTLLNGKQDTLSFDNTPTENSNNPVKSGGVYTALSGKANTSDIISDFDDLTNRPLESDAIDIDDLDLPMPAKPTEYPILFDETGTEYKVGLYKRASDGKVKPVYKKFVILSSSVIVNTSWINICQISDVEKIVNNITYDFSGLQVQNIEFTRYSSGYVQAITISGAGHGIDAIMVEYTKTTDEWREI